MKDLEVPGPFRDPTEEIDEARDIQRVKLQSHNSDVTGCLVEYSREDLD